jgi:lysophospholipase L1-like esterase
MRNDFLNSMLTGAAMQALSAELEQIAANGYTTPVKTSFFEPFANGTNLFDKTTVVSGYTFNGSGALEANAGFVVTDYMRVEDARKYYIKHARAVAFYDVSKTYVGQKAIASPYNDAVVTTPATAKYMRFYWYLSHQSVNAQQVNAGAIALTYAAYSAGYRLISGTATPGIVGYEPPILNVPLKVFGVVGHEMNIYYDNIVDDITKYNIDISCAVGTRYADRWTYTPVSAGTTAMTISLYIGNVLVNSVVTSIVVKAATVGDTLNRKCLFIGDSTTVGLFNTDELSTLFTADAAMDITFLGTQGSAPDIHEGYSGWSMNEFINSVSSPFKIAGVLNFSGYMSAHGYSGVDRVIINLGINDIAQYVSDAALIAAIPAILANYNTLIANIKVFDATVKIGIAVTIPPSYSQDAFPSSSRWRYKRTLAMWNLALLSAFDNRESENLYIVPIHTALDTKNNMSTTTMAVNSRSATTVTVQNNAYHPATDGYEQIADAFYFWIKSLET